MSNPTPARLCGPKVAINLQHLVASSDAADSYIETYTTYATVPAILIPNNGSQKYLDEKTTETSSLTAYLSYRGDITTTDRISYGGHFYSIEMLKNPFSQGKLIKLILKMVPV